ncbi:MAG: vanadium-dependent haloperoxidase [Chitinophagales bacterium]
MILIKKIIIPLFVWLSFGCNEKTKIIPNDYFISWNDLTIQTMKTDGINPVLATRIYLYPNIAAYEVMAHAADSLTPFSGKITGLDSIPAPENKINYNWAAITAYYKVMLKLNYREDLYHDLYENQYLYFQDLYASGILKNSSDYGEKIANVIIKWAEDDHYKQTKGMPYYINSEVPGSWVPTPPEYRSALEPHWGKLRALTIDSLPMFSQAFTINFSEDSASEFYNLARAVYDSSINLKEEQTKIAWFWDDNPDLNNFKGHMPVPRRHINPTSHWMSIIGQVSRKEQLSFAKTIQIYAAASIAFFDANLVSWYDKYHYNLIRPVTYIQQHIDPKWMPLLVTPPFPEHTSAHSSCSAACASILEHFLGDEYTFTDSTHYKIGLGTRSFDSFSDAAWEVSLSRYYGGIHYMTAIQQGNTQGNEIGNHIIKKLEL